MTDVVQLADEAALDCLDRLIARSRNDGVIVLADDLIVADAALAPVIDAEFTGSVVLVAPSVRDGDVRVRHHQVVAAGSQFHQIRHPDRRLVGALRIAPSQEAERALIELRDAVRAGDVPADDLFALIVVALVRGGVVLRAVDIVDVPWFRSPDDPDGARHQVDGVSAERIARLQANRVDDGFYSTFIVRKVAKPFTRLALRLNLSPNTITVISLIVGLGAAASFSGGTRAWLIVGAVLLQLSLVIDCVDGEVARATRRFTQLGAWLDASTDRVKEMLVYAGLAAGAASTGAWQLAIALIVLQTTRHMMDYDFAAVQRQRECALIIRDIRDPNDAGSAGDWSAERALEASAAANRRPIVRWTKKVIHLPIGERWLILSVVAVIAGGTWALAVLFIAGLVAFVYTLLGRTLRTRGWRGPSSDAIGTLLARQFDASSILTRIVPATMWRSPAAWAIPAAVRFIELGVIAVLVIVWVPAGLVLGFWWAAIVAFHDYDLLYRSLHDAAMPNWITNLALGWDGRTLVLVLAAIFGVLVTVLGVGVWWLAVVLVFVASVQWLRSVQR